MFDQDIPAASKALSSELYGHLDSLHRNIADYANENELNPVVLHLLGEQLANNLSILRQCADKLNAVFSDQQRDCNRLIVPIIAGFMEEAYLKCVAVKGKHSRNGNSNSR